MLNRLRISLIAEWKSSWKLWSVQINALGLMLMTFGVFIRDAIDWMPSSLVGRLPHAETIGIIFFGLGLIARILRQERKDDNDKQA